MNQPPKLQTAQQPQKDWSGPIATLSISFLDFQNQLNLLKKQMQDAFNGFVQLQQIYSAKFDEFEKRLVALEPKTGELPGVEETPKAA